MDWVEKNNTHENVFDAMNNENLCPEHRSELQRIFAMSMEDQTA